MLRFNIANRFHCPSVEGGVVALPSSSFDTIQLVMIRTSNVQHQQVIDFEDIFLFDTIWLYICTMQKPSYSSEIAGATIWFRMMPTQIRTWVYKDFSYLMIPIISLYSTGSTVVKPMSTIISLWMLSYDIIHSPFTSRKYYQKEPQPKWVVVL